MKLFFLLAGNPKRNRMKRKRKLCIQSRLGAKQEINVKSSSFRSKSYKQENCTIHKERVISCITTWDVSVHPFEIGYRGYISPSNKANLKKLLKFTNPVLVSKQCEKIYQSLAVLLSSHIFKKRKNARLGPRNSIFDKPPLNN